MLEFIKAHYNLLIECAVAFIVIFVSIFRKRSVNDIQALIYKFAHKAVLDIEDDKDLSGKSELKLHYAVLSVKQMLKALFPDLAIDSYSNIIIKVVEEFLDTPQRHKEV